MKNQTIEIKQKVRNVKTLHFFMMVVWPILLFAAIGLDGFYTSILETNFSYSMGISNMLLILLWLLYAYFMLAIMRNYNLQEIMSEYCEFDAYLECMTYLEKFYILKKSRLSQRLNRTDAYLVSGDFDAAYENLNRFKELYPKLSIKTQMMYDYFWCRFYGELEDAENYKICLDVFQKNWLNNPNLSRKLMRQAAMLFQELAFRQMVFEKNGIAVKSYLTKVYKAGRIGTKYDFIKYCYFMGKAEYILENLMLAKHWFAQTVSFGLKEQMTKNAKQLLDRLEEMHIPYALTPPSDNVYYGKPKSMRISSGLLSIFLSLLLVLVIIAH